MWLWIDSGQSESANAKVDCPRIIALRVRATNLQILQRRHTTIIDKRKPDIFWQYVSSRTIPVPKTLSDTTRKACILFSYSTLSCSHNRDDLVLLELLTNNLPETLRVPPKRKQTSPTSALNKKNRRPCWVRPRRDWRIFAGPSCVSYNYTIIIYYIYYKYYKYID